MPSNVVFWGATGHAKVLGEFVAQLGYQVVALFDNQPGLSSPLAGVPLYIGWEGFSEWHRSNRAGASFLIAIGGDKGADRIEIHRRLELQGLTAISATHPKAFVAANARLAPGCQVLANASVGAETQLGMQTIVNTNASVDHECRLGHGVHIAPGATLAGCVEVGDRSLIGAGAVVLPRVKIGRDVTVGAGAVVLRDVPDGATVVGNPARTLRKVA